MILYSAPASPFGRMVKLTAHCLGQIGGIEVKATNTGDPEDETRAWDAAKKKERAEMEAAVAAERQKKRTALEQAAAA